MPKFCKFIFLTKKATSKQTKQLEKLDTFSQKGTSQKIYLQSYSAFDKQLSGIICELKTYIESARKQLCMLMTLSSF